MTLVLIFLSSTLLGLVLGTALCVRYLRQEMTARIGPQLDLVLLKLDNIQYTVLASTNYYPAPRLNSPATGQHEHRPSTALPSATTYPG